MAEYKKEEILVIGKANPTGSAKYIETVCTGGITRSGKLVRIYPVPFRQLKDDQKFSVWSWIEVEITKSSDDNRPETYKINLDKPIKVISKPIKDDYEKEKMIKSVALSSLEEATRLKDETGLGLVIVPVTNVNFYAKPKQTKETYYQSHMFYDDFIPLPSVPYSFHFSYQCKNSGECRTHNQIYLAWEPYAAYGKFRKKYEDPIGEIVAAQMRRVDESIHELYFLVTTHRRYKKWMVGQEYHFKKSQEDIPKSKESFIQSDLSLGI